MEGLYTIPYLRKGLMDNGFSMGDGMNKQTIGFSISFLIHAVSIVLMLSASNLIAVRNKPIVIDFRIGNSASATDETSDRRQIATYGHTNLQDERENIHTEPAEVRQPQMPTAEIKKHIEEESHVAVPVEEKPIKAAERVAGWASSAGNGQAQPTLPSDGEGGGFGKGDAAGSGLPGKRGDALENAKNLYLKEHFAYIRDTIMKNLSYPAAARKMGWEGKVVVSFIVCEDGFVKDIKVMESSGFPVLDNNAIEIIRKASPFPKPPGRAELVVPIVYKLM